MPIFERLLIANRGEIACRVIETARRLGIYTIAVFSEADAGARHVRMADEAHCIGPARPAESYLVAESILEAARRSDARALHPGYGFLSENAEFAEACAQAGITFVGPGPDAIRAMGMKDAAKASMEAAGVPVVPGYHGEAQDLATLSAAAEKIGFPLLVKAVAGGGGRGMRRVDSAGDLEAALEGAAREAGSAFGHEQLLLERFIERARHVEVQVFADRHGDALHLFERDCSIQRRHQKVVEEAPAPGMTEELRAAMGDAAVRVARAIDYEGAGTVEFILDAGVAPSEASFYFMEMNTRLQVEHPVTECITGQDLVEWQLRVAAGEPLPRRQDELGIAGHAIEVRLYAEDPSKKFMPSTGPLARLRFPEAGGGVRIDTGVSEGDVITPFYDPMIAKLIAFGDDREQARRRLQAALAAVEVVGPRTNATMLHDTIGHESFAAGDLHTRFLEQHAEALLTPRPVFREVLAAAALHVLLERRAHLSGAARGSQDPWSPWCAADGFRISGSAWETLVFDPPGRAEPLCVEVRSTASGWELRTGGQVDSLEGLRDAAGQLQLLLGERKLTARACSAGETVHVWYDGGHWRLEHRATPRVRHEEDVPTASLSSTLPGRVASVRVAAGDRVRRGDVLLVIEAMKMEYELRAPAGGVVAEVLYAEGDVVEEGVALLRFEDA